MAVIYFFEKFQAYMNTSQEYIMPGRQVTVFLFLFNLAQWIVFTFEIQKVRASHVEEGESLFTVEPRLLHTPSA